MKYLYLGILILTGCNRPPVPVQASATTATSIKSSLPQIHKIHFTSSDSNFNDLKQLIEFTEQHTVFRLMTKGDHKPVNMLHLIDEYPSSLVYEIENVYSKGVTFKSPKARLSVAQINVASRAQRDTILAAMDSVHWLNQEKFYRTVVLDSTRIYVVSVQDYGWVLDSVDARYIPVLRRFLKQKTR